MTVVRSGGRAGGDMGSSATGRRDEGVSSSGMAGSDTGARDGGVLVVGSVNADLVMVVDGLPAVGETVTGARFERHWGGKGANQAVAARRYGAAVRMAGAVGDDDFGRE